MPQRTSRRVLWGLLSVTLFYLSPVAGHLTITVFLFALCATDQSPSWAELKEAKRLAASRKVESSNGNGTFATKQATIRYAAWVSSEFEDVVYDAFEAILEMPEVALLVADKMRSMGNDHSAAILERYTFNDKCDWGAIKRPHKNTQEGLRAAVARGTITQAWAIELGLKVR